MLSKKITRRQALKVILAAGGGLTAAAFLPSKWLKPLVMSGVLPVHARASAPGYTSTNPALAGDSSGNTNGHQFGAPYSYIYYDYNPGLSGSTITATLIGADVSGVDVEMDVTHIVGTASFGYFDGGAKTLPVNKTADAGGVAHFTFLQAFTATAGTTFDLSFTYKRSGTILHVSYVSFTIV